MSEDDFNTTLVNLIQETLNKHISPYIIIGSLETQKLSIINILLGVKKNECE
jgi:hypothetical protein